MIPTKPNDHDRAEYVKNIKAAFEAASDDQKTRGRNWYRSAHQLAYMMADGDVASGAGVIAALSANKSWPLNVKLAQTAFDTGTPSGHVRNALNKAERIMNGEFPEEVLPMGSKTGNFYRCILDPEDPEPVCIDRHAHDIAVGEPWGDKDRGLSAKGRYAILAHAYREAAIQLDEIPSVVQAVTWVYWVEKLDRPQLRNYSRD